MTGFKPGGKGTAKILLILLAFVLAAAGFLAYVFFIEPVWLKTTEYTIYDEKIPAEFDGYEIVFVSDIHHGPFVSYERVEELKERINSMEPDLVLLGGDYVHRGPAYVAPVFRALTGLQAADGVMGVLGNHDHWDGEQETRDGFAIAGITDIDNRSVFIENGHSMINVSGVGDFDEDVQVFVRDEDVFTILVSHNPDYISKLDADRPDLMLSGHTHGGQVTLFGLWAPFIPSEFGNRFRYGEITYNDITLIVTSGVGTITPPARFFARPEIVRITLRSGNGD
ncbi:MAG: metallophosphoesterase [Clostridia bacterium]|nr:metallophosphoesterase [Clostridia bacterium]